jgi:hypothetical protein
MKFIPSVTFFSAMIAMAMAENTLSKVKCAGVDAVEQCSAQISESIAYIEFKSKPAKNTDDYYGRLVTDAGTCPDIASQFNELEACSSVCEIASCENTAF